MKGWREGEEAERDMDREVRSERDIEREAMGRGGGRDGREARQGDIWIERG